MILQNIVFPENRYDEINELYYKSTKTIKILNKYSIEMQPDSFLSLFSYFNSFSIQRWSTYTSIHTLDINIILRGSGIIKLMHQTPKQTQCIQYQDFCFNREERIVLHLEELPKEGFCYFTITSTPSSPVTVKRAFFSSECTKNTIHIAIATCTFRREAYITANMKRIYENILKNNDSPLKEHLDIYIVDNGQTLCSEQFPHEKITLISNANTGGSGGFTRGLIEILHNKEKNGYTHALLMDDDIQLETESLERTYSFLSCLKEIYLDSTIGGAMLRNDYPCVLEEAGANWNGKLNAMGRGLKLNQKDALFQYDNLPNTEYQAWWYCCIPLSLIDLTNLPLPFFIHADDVEYGLRNYKQVIQLNGICVWHDTFENKRPSSLEYYDVRNYLILNSICRKEISLYQQITQQFKRSTASILRMRYDDVLLHIKGIEDFLKGPDWWCKQDITKLHQEIIAAGYKYLPIPDDICFEKYYIKTDTPVTLWKKILSLTTINGAFLPKKKEPVIIDCGSYPFILNRRKEAYLWDPGTGNAIHVHFSLTKMIFMYLLLMKTLLRLLLHYPKVKIRYKKAVKQIGTERFWKRYQ